MLPRGTMTIGRGAGNDLVLPIAAASRRHAEIRFDGRGWQLVDLGSTNGTTIDGCPLEAHRPYPLHSGSQVGLAGQPAFHFEAIGVSSAPIYAGVRTASPARAGISPWIAVLAVLAIVLLIVFGMLLRLLLL